jgi:aminoglycoside phosphotransferase (APT) family kinase protein
MCMSASAVTKELPPDPWAAGQTLSDFVRESGLRALVIGTSKVPNAKLTVMLVSPVSGRSELAVKVPTTDVAAKAIEDEAAMLVSLDALALDMESTIPRVVGQVDFHGRTGVVMTAVRGTPMATSYARGRHTADRARVGADFAAVDRWLAALQRATAAGSGPVDLGAGIAESLAARFGEDETAEDLSRLAEVRRRLRTSVVPRTVVHGDLWLGNLLLTDGVASGVVDWEGAEPRGEPLRDLVRFAITYALFLDRHTRPGRRVRGHPELRAGTWGAGVEYALDGAGWFPDLVRAFLQDGLARLGADPARWRDAALAGVAEFAALTDDPVFGRSILELFRRLAR